MALSSRYLSFLNGSIRNLNYLRARTSGFPIKDFGNDKKRGVIPECIYQESKLFKDKIQA